MNAAKRTARILLNRGETKINFAQELSNLGLVLNKLMHSSAEVESRTQGSRPRPRTQKKIRGQGQGQPFRGQTLSRPRTGMLEAKAKDQGHRCKSSPKKKGLQKFFSGDLQFIGVTRILIGGALNHKSHEITSSKFFQRRSFCGTKISQNGRSEIVALFERNQDFAKVKGFKLIVKKCKYLTLVTCWEN